MWETRVGEHGIGVCQGYEGFCLYHLYRGVGEEERNGEQRFFLSVRSIYHTYRDIHHLTFVKTIRADRSALINNTQGKGGAKITAQRTTERLMDEVMVG